MKLMKHPKEIFFDSFPAAPEEGEIETIGTRAFGSLALPDRTHNLFLRKDTREKLTIQNI